MSKVQGRAPVRLLSVEELAEMLQVPIATVYRWQSRGDGPTGMRIGRYVRFDPGDVASWLEGRKASGRLGGRGR